VKRHAVHHLVLRRLARGACLLDRVRLGRLGLLLALTCLLGITVWSHWRTMGSLSSAWRSNDDFSAGQLVPLVAAFLIWRDRKLLRGCSLAPCWGAGITLLVFAQMAHLCSLVYGARPSITQYAFVLTIGSLVLLVAGWQVSRRVFWVLMFLFLMVPPPGAVYNAVSGPLQGLATTGSVFLLEAFGTRVMQEGNVVILGDNTPMAVAEACSGLRMLTAFIIVAAFIAYMIKRPRWQKGALLLSSIPVAMICNMVRISATAMIMLYVSVELGEKFFHDFAGLVMMPIAVSLIFGEIWLMDRIIVPERSGDAASLAHNQIVVWRGRRQEGKG
jgi:exosortase